MYNRLFIHFVRIPVESVAPLRDMFTQKYNVQEYT